MGGGSRSHRERGGAHDAVGSSPLTRGTLGRQQKPSATRGLIPAHAGNTIRGGAFIEGCPAHPRSHGEHPILVRGLVRLRGSSPLTRGPFGGGCGGSHPRGLIPAHAGTIPPSKSLAPGAEAHPRSRGDHMRVPISIPTTLGSSPLTRGPSHVPSQPPLAAGLIPAHAGTIRAGNTPLGRYWAHLRSRGDHPEPTRQAREERGSSPLTRGPFSR